MSQDSMSPFAKGGINGYVFANNNPIMQFDPSGHFSITAWVGVIATIANLANLIISVATVPTVGGLLLPITGVAFGGMGIGLNFLHTGSAEDGKQGETISLLMVGASIGFAVAGVINEISVMRKARMAERELLNTYSEISSDEQNPEITVSSRSTHTETASPLKDELPLGSKPAGEPHTATPYKIYPSLDEEYRPITPSAPPLEYGTQVTPTAPPVEYETQEGGVCQPLNPFDTFFGDVCIKYD